MNSDGDDCVYSAGDGEDCVTSDGDDDLTRENRVPWAYHIMSYAHTTTIIATLISTNPMLCLSPECSWDLYKPFKGGCCRLFFV